MSPLEMCQPDLMLYEAAAAEEEDLLMLLNNSNHFMSSDILQNEPELHDFSLQVFNCLPLQACGSILQWAFVVYVNH